MFSLKEIIGEIEYPFGYDAAVTALLERFRELGIQVEHTDQAKRRMEVRCLGLVTNWGLWRCWSDRVRLELETANEGRKTIVKLYAIPNLMRIRTRKDEQVMDYDTLVARLAPAGVSE